MTELSSFRDGHQLDVFVQGLRLGLFDEADASDENAPQLRRESRPSGTEPPQEGVVLRGIDGICLVLALDDVEPRQRPAAILQEEVDLPPGHQPVRVYPIAEQLEKHSHPALKSTSLGGR